VVLDVVFNHMAEGNENGPILSFRGIDNSIYYMLAPKGQFAMCQNTGFSSLLESKPKL